MPNGTLRSFIQGPLTVEDDSLTVRDVFGMHGWDWSMLSFQIPNNILMEINSIPYSVRAIQGEDRLIWTGANRRDFDLKHAYALAMGSESDGGSFNGMWVWKLDTIPWVKTFIPLLGNWSAFKMVRTNDFIPLPSFKKKKKIFLLRKNILTSKNLKFPFFPTLMALGEPTHSKQKQKNKKQRIL